MSAWVSQAPLTNCLAPSFGIGVIGSTRGFGPRSGGSSPSSRATKEARAIGGPSASMCGGGNPPLCQIAQRQCSALLRRGLEVRILLWQP